jgi:hypothetical protein
MIANQSFGDSVDLQWISIIVHKISRAGVQDGKQPIQQYQRNLHLHQQMQDVFNALDIPEPNKRAKVDSLL